MYTSKMRQEFEDQFIEEYVRVLGEGARELAVHTLAANPPLVSMYWWAWQASREAVVVELPSVEENGTLTRGVVIGVLGVVRSNIEAQGLKVAG